jgi:hypothetical protein
MPARDGSSPAAVSVGGGSQIPATTASFTPPAGARLTAHVSWDSLGTEIIDHTITDSEGGDWTQDEFSDSSNGGSRGGCRLFTRDQLTTNVAMTVTSTPSGNTSRGQRLQVNVWTDVHDTTPVGATNRSTGTTTSVSTSLTTTVDGSLAVGSGLDWQGGTFTAGAGQTRESGAAGAATGWHVRRDAETSPEGATSLSGTGSGSPEWQQAVVELLGPEPGPPPDQGEQPLLVVTPRAVTRG